MKTSKFTLKCDCQAKEHEINFIKYEDNCVLINYSLKPLRFKERLAKGIRYIFSRPEIDESGHFQDTLITEDKMNKLITFLKKKV